MEPTNLVVTDEWQSVDIDGAITLQVRQGKIFLGHTTQPASARDAYVISKSARIKGVKTIFMKTAANNRESSSVVIGSVEDDGGGGDDSDTPRLRAEEITVSMASGGIPGAVPSLNSFGNNAGAILRYSTKISTDAALSETDITAIKIVQPLVSYKTTNAAGSMALTLSTFTVDKITNTAGTNGNIAEITFTLYLNAPTIEYKLLNTGAAAPVTVFSTSDAEKLRVSIRYIN